MITNHLRSSEKREGEGNRETRVPFHARALKRTRALFVSPIGQKHEASPRTHVIRYRIVALALSGR